ncbi:TDP-N-acetylfucosamine:lipid II N-acetylfucosaminyltransferase [Alteromonadaceae bacterium BrNp21-10]|nr:TDP-N-acetylfucosamine:lipid II N-acetylfucosaminyltransferase [Alteromonadaceae bacterium BrNp21-10]
MHIFGQSPHHYVPMKTFFDKVMEDQPCSQQYWAWHHPEQVEHLDFHYYANSVELMSLMKSAPVTTRFVFHGFFDRSLWPKLLLSNLSKHCIWICWGHDIYQHHTKGRPLKLKLMHFIHRLLVKRLVNCCALNAGDSELIKATLRTSNVDVLPYPLIGSNIERNVQGNDRPQTILLGNSASPNNNHIEALSWLSGFAEENIKIIAPLNYAGPVEYVQQVIECGNALFGDKFDPITQMLQKEEYDRLIASCDIVVFAHDRQQGLYVVYSAFKQGQKIFIRSNTSSFKSLNKFGFNLFASEKIAEMEYSEFINSNLQDAQNNQELMERTFSEKALIPQWQQALQQLLDV